MFDDAAEFALVVNIGSIAHPPGTPAYIFFGMLWTKLLSITGLNTINALTLFSSFCISLASVLFFLTLKAININVFRIENIKSSIICCSTAIAFSTAATSWAWGNTIEVYGFQVLSMATAFYGLTFYHFYRNNLSIFIASAGLAAGLSNHHLTMILFLPFIFLFFTKNLFDKELIIDKKKSKIKSESFITLLFNVLLMVLTRNYL